MISLSWVSSFEPNSYDANAHIGSLMKAYRNLPKHIAKKHMMAAMRKCLRPAVPILRRNTPPLSTRRGRRKAGEKRSTGELRKAVTVKTGQTGKNGDFGAFVFGTLGYKMTGRNRKAIWLNYGTSRGGPAFDMIGKTMAQFGPVAASTLATELAAALDKATAEVAGKRNLGYQK